MILTLVRHNQFLLFVWFGLVLWKMGCVFIGYIASCIKKLGVYSKHQHTIEVWGNISINPMLGTGDRQISEASCSIRRNIKTFERSSQKRWMKRDRGRYLTSISDLHMYTHSLVHLHSHITNTFTYNTDTKHNYTNNCKIQTLLKCKYQNNCHSF